MTFCMPSTFFFIRRKGKKKRENTIGRQRRGATIHLSSATNILVIARKTRHDVPFVALLFLSLLLHLNGENEMKIEERRK